MIRSMTAFSHRELTTEHGTLQWEARSVNHRYLDISLRLPEEFRSQENSFRETIQATLKRGKVETNLRFTPANGNNNEIRINEPLARALIIACRQLETITDNPEPLKAVDILRWRVSRKMPHRIVTFSPRTPKPYCKIRWMICWKCVSVKASV